MVHFMSHPVCPLLQAKKLEAEVLAPMQRWTTAYNTVQARMNKLEGVRLEVDSRRRTVAELGQKIDKQRARLPQTKVKGEFDIEQTIKRVQHKENKLAGLLSVTAQLRVQGEPSCMTCLTVLCTSTRCSTLYKPGYHKFSAMNQDPDFCS